MERRAFLTDTEIAFLHIKSMEAEAACYDYSMWRRYRTTEENDAARQRMENALAASRLMNATAGNTVH